MDLDTDIALPGGPPGPVPADPADAAPGLDRRLAGAHELVRAGEIDVLSLDVFDTLLWRKAPDPVDVFPIVAVRLVELGLWPSDSDPRLFSRLRQAAEWHARQARRAAAGGSEVTLPEIYGFMAMRAAPEDLAAIEVEVERELLVPDLDVTALAATAAERGVRVIAVSDTYFGEADLRGFLAAAPLGRVPIERVHASSRYRVGKATGLFFEVLRQLGVPPQRVLHVGDNRDADVVAAGHAGLRTAWYERRPERLGRLLDEEATQLRALSPQRPDALTSTRPGAGDHGLAGLRAKVAHREERARQPDALRPFWDYGATVLGPPLAGFADWVQERAAALGADTVLCLMREGAMLAELVEAAGALRDQPVRARPAWLSRQVLARASVTECTPAELERLLTRASQPTLRQFLATLGLGPADLPALAHRGDARLGDGGSGLADPGLAPAAIEAVASTPSVRAKVLAAAQATRQRILRYLRSVLGPDAGRVVLVDLGWAGTIQAMLQRLLVEEGEPLSTAGLYLITQQVATDRILEGVHLEGYLGHAGFPEPGIGAFMRSPELLEQVCMPDHGTQLDLTDDLEPVLEDQHEAFAFQSVQRHAMQDGVFAFQRHWIRYRAAAGGRLGPLTGEGRELLLAILLRAVLAPDRDEAALFSTWVHDENYGSEAIESIVSGHAAPAARHLDPVALVNLSMKQVYWPFAMAALQDRHLAEAAGLVAAGALDADLFSSPLETGDVEMFVDIGWGFGAAGSASVPVRRNRNGLSYARADLRAAYIQRVRVDPTQAPAIVRLDFMTLTCWPHDRSEPVVLRLESDEDLAGLELHHCSRLGPRLLRVHGSDPQIVVDVQSRVGRAWRVEVEVGFAVMPLSRTQARQRYDDAKDALAILAKTSRYGAPVRLARRVQRRLG